MNYTYLSILCALFIFSSNSTFSQNSYTNSKGAKHLLGEIELEHLHEAEFGDWYFPGFEKFSPEINIDFKNKFYNVKVKAFIGTWCGDTKFLLPRFIKFWTEAGLKLDQIELIALHNEGSEYKRSPQRIEDRYNIHRVPTFIFEQEDIEIGRIVERPINSLETDIIQIALGFPSKPRYQAASMVCKYLESQNADSLLLKMNELERATSRIVSTSAELNTLGYVLKSKNLNKKAEVVFILNTKLFKHDPNTFDSLGEFYYDTYRFEESISCFEHVLSIKGSDERASNMIKLMKDSTQE